MNSAHRIINIISLLQNNANNNETMLTVFSETFHFSDMETFQKELLFYKIIVKMREELTKSMQQINASNKMKEERYKESFTSLFHLLNPRLIDKQWLSIYSQVHPSAFAMVGAVGDLLENDENEIDPKFIYEIFIELKNWEAEIIASDYPEELKIFLLKSIDIIKEGLRDYFIIGVEAFQKSYRDTYFHFVQFGDYIKERKESNKGISKLKMIWGKINLQVDKASKLIKLLDTANKIYEYGKKAEDFLSK